MERALLRLRSVSGLSQVGLAVAAVPQSHRPLGLFADVLRTCDAALAADPNCRVAHAPRVASRDDRRPWPASWTIAGSGWASTRAEHAGTTTGQLPHEASTIAGSTPSTPLSPLMSAEHDPDGSQGPHCASTLARSDPSTTRLLLGGAWSGDACRGVRRVTCPAPQTRLLTSAHAQAYGAVDPLYFKRRARNGRARWFRVNALAHRPGRSRFSACVRAFATGRCAPGTRKVRARLGHCACNSRRGAHTWRFTARLPRCTCLVDPSVLPGDASACLITASPPQCSWWASR